MNGRKSQPPDKGRTNETADDVSELNGIEIKQEPNVKLEPENTAEIVTVSIFDRAAIGSIGSKQMGATYDFINVCESAEAKPAPKKEKIDKEENTNSLETSGKGGIGSPSTIGVMNFYPKRKQSKPKRSSGGSKKTKKNVATARNRTKTDICIKKKKRTVSKAKGKQHKCSSCDYIASQKCNLDKHLRKHTGEKPFPCTHCTKRFAQKHQLQSHIRSHVSEFLFSCSNCLKGFSKEDEKLEHEISCKIRRYECHLCKEYSTFKKSNLESHMRVHHTGEKPFGCDRCSKKFYQQSELKSHMKTHLNPRPLKPKCSVCYRNFYQPIEKDEHESKCKSRGYECYLCKEFTSNQQYHLKDHMRTHTGLKPFQCQVCQKYLTTKSIRERHLKNVHKY